MLLLPTRQKTLRGELDGEPADHGGNSRSRSLTGHRLATMDARSAVGSGEGQVAS